MEFGTIGGIGGVFVAVLISMVLEGSSPMAIVLLPALLLVFFGTFGAAMAGNLVKDLPAVLRDLKKSFVGKPGGRPEGGRPPSSRWPTSPGDRACWLWRRWCAMSRTPCCVRGSS